MDKHGYTDSTIQKRSLAVYLWPGGSSSRGDSFYQVFLLTLALGADGEGVEHAERERIPQGVVLPVTQIALAQDFHSDDSFSGSLHFAQYAYNRVGIRVHVRTNRVDAHQIHFHPGRLGGGAQRFDAVAGASM